MLGVKLITVFLLLVIFYQDVKERLVYGFLFPVTAVFFGILHYYYVEKTSFYIGIGGNIAFVSLLLLVLFLYSKVKLNMPFLNGSFGLGDLLFFYAICFAFPSSSFIILFVFSIFFSLLVHIVLKRQLKDKTVPLAGYMALFFAFTLVISMFYNPVSLYLL